jgi:hypothetical protein
MNVFMLASFHIFYARRILDATRKFYAGLFFGYIFCFSTSKFKILEKLDIFSSFKYFI